MKENLPLHIYIGIYLLDRGPEEVKAVTIARHLAASVRFPTCVMRSPAQAAFRLNNLTISSPPSPHRRTPYLHHQRSLLPDLKLNLSLGFIINRAFQLIFSLYNIYVHARDNITRSEILFAITYTLRIPSINGSEFKTTHIQIINYIFISVFFSPSAYRL